MAAIEMANRDGGFIESEANGYRSRDTVTVDASGGALVAGTVLGLVTGGDYIAHDGDAVDGSEVAVAVLLNGVGAVSGEAAIFARDGEVAQADLTYAAGADAAAILAANAELAANGIIVRVEG